MSALRLPSPLQKIEYKGLDVWIKRDDLIHPDISGNKWRKLKYHLEKLRKMDLEGIVSFGGAFSNHLHALAAAGEVYGFSTVGIVRGEPCQNPTLDDAARWGMKLHFVSREEYRKKTDTAYIKNLQERYPKHLIVPEGGTSPEAVRGIAELWDEIDIAPTVVIAPVGSGGTIAGIIAGAPKSVKKIYGVLAIKNGGYMKDLIAPLLGHQPVPSWQLLEEFHFGGFAKISAELISFARQFEQQYHIPLDLVYNTKAFFALDRLIENQQIKKGNTILYLHTGGLQGNRGLAQKINRLSIPQ